MVSEPLSRRERVRLSRQCTRRAGSGRVCAGHAFPQWIVQSPPGHSAEIERTKETSTYGLWTTDILRIAHVN